jgi:pimeloyl-ACP methyl ester carboxylesterase
MTKQLRSSDGTEIAVEAIGEGPGIVLVDGAFGSRAWGSNVALAPLLAPNFTVYRYDRRGRGESGDPPSPGEGVDALAKALPNARRRTIAAQPHDVDPTALVPVLIEFFESTS